MVILFLRRSFHVRQIRSHAFRIAVCIALTRIQTAIIIMVVNNEKPVHFRPKIMGNILGCVMVTN